MTGTEDIKKQLLNTLVHEIEGEIHTDDLRNYMLATDGSIYRKQPLAVAYPRNETDVEKIVNFSRQHKVSIHSRGSGSGLCGSALGAGIVIDFSKFMNQLLNIDLENRWFECQPGYRFGELEDRLQGSGLFFPPDPSSGEYASFGGMYGTNASGAHSVKYGNVSDYILDAEVQFANGSRQYLSEIAGTPINHLPENLNNIARLYAENKDLVEKSYPEIKCNVAGYNLRGLVEGDRLNMLRLFAGAEGTLGVVTRLRFKLEQKPSFDSMVVAFFDTIISSAKAVQQVMPMGPSGIEIMDKSLLNLAKDNDPKLRDKIPDDIDNVLLIEFDAFEEHEARSSAEKAKELIVQEGLTNQAHLAASEEEKARFWAVRKAAVPILYKLKGEKKILALIEDAAIPINGLVDYFDGIYEILNRYKLRFVVYGHIAKGLMHTRPLLNLKDENDVALLKPIADEVYDLVTGLDGTVSGEHGDGRIRSAYVKRRYPEIYHLFEKIKKTLDVDNLFNPEIITNTDEGLIHSDLRFGSNYCGSELANKLLVWNEGFNDQVETCHGCSKCTTVTTATRMCPIYKFTRDESASPKAKANVLRALISGEINEKSLYQKHFQEVIDHCVNCGSCYQECPSNVNIPKLALEARAQYVKRRGATLQSRVLSNIETAARTTFRFSNLSKPLFEKKWFKSMMEKLVGVSAQRDMISFDKTPLRKRIKEVEGTGQSKVLYFAGCYASYIKPEIGEAAISVLKKAGMTVLTPEQHCCGLPILSKGMVKEARNKINKNLERWYETLEDVEHIVVTCSSCGLSLLQEWSYLLDSDKIKTIRQKLIHITSLLQSRVEQLTFKSDPMKIGYHMPCHLKVQDNSQASLTLLRQVPGVEISDLNSHCCGIAGSWGMSKDHFELSKSIASDMIDRLDNSDAEYGATDCPTCRIQMEQFSQKPILHPIEIISKQIKTF